MEIKDTSKDSIQIHSDSQAAQQAISESAASSKPAEFQRDSLKTAERESGKASKTIPTQPNAALLPPPNNEELPSNKNEGEVETAKNPYFAQGARMAGFWILMLTEIIPLLSEMRQTENENRMLTRENKYDSQMTLATVKYDAKMNEASQEFVQAMGSGMQAVNSTVEVARLSTTDIKAQSEYNTTRDKAQAEADTATQQFTDYKETIAREKLGIPKEQVQAGASPAEIERIQNQDNDVKAYMDNPDNYKDKNELAVKDSPNEPDRTVSEKYKDLEKKATDAQEAYKNTVTNQSTIISSNRQHIDTLVNTQQNIVKSLSESFIHAIGGVQKMEAAEIQKVLAEGEAGVELTSSYLQGYESSMNKAQQSFDKMLQTFSQSYQSYVNSLSTRA